MLKKLNMARCPNFTDKGIITVVESCKDLVEVNMAENENVTGVTLCMILGLPLPSLSGSAHHSTLTSTALNTMSTAAGEHERAAHRLKYLKDLDVSGCTRITERIPRVIRHASEAVGTETHNQSNNSSSSSQSPTPAIINNVVTPKESLNISLRNLNLSNLPQLSDSLLYLLLERTPKLRSLYLSRCPLLTDFGMGAVALTGKSLHVLHLGHCSGLGDDGIVRVAKACTKLKFIDLATLNITDKVRFFLSKSTLLYFTCRCPMLLFKFVVQYQLTILLSLFFM
jgi:F-box and leucine-rich repeat protein GRR1